MESIVDISYNQIGREGASGGERKSYSRREIEIGRSVALVVAVDYYTGP